MESIRTLRSRRQGASDGSARRSQGVSDGSARRSPVRLQCGSNTPASQSERASDSVRFWIRPAPISADSIPIQKECRNFHPPPESGLPGSGPSPHSQPNLKVANRRQEFRFTTRYTEYFSVNAKVAELADALDLGSSGATLEGSSPSFRINNLSPEGNGRHVRPRSHQPIK